MTVTVRRRTPEERAIPAREVAYDRLYAVLSAFEETVIRRVPPGEVASWTKKEAAARAQKVGTADTGQVTMLAIEAGITGETIGALADRIIARADAYTQFAAALAGVRRKHEAAIAAASDGFDAIVAGATAELQGFFG